MRFMMSENKKSEGRILAAAEVAPETQVRSASGDLLLTAADSALTEDLALALLKHADLHPDCLEQLAKNANALKSRKVKIALASHPNTPRHVSVPLTRQFYTFDLMKVALSPSVPADVRVAVDDVLISRLKAVTVGERLTLARRASGRVAAALLLNIEIADSKIIDRKISDAKTAASVALVQAVARHGKWSRRKEIRAALLRTAHLSLARALEFSREIPVALLQDILASSRLPARIKDHLLRESQTVA